MAGHAQLKFIMTECSKTQISLTGPIYRSYITGSVPAIYIMEQMMEHVARKLNKDPMAVKTLNLYKQGQVRPRSH